MIVPMLVLAATLVTLLALVVGHARARRSLKWGESDIVTPNQLDIAIETQRVQRLAELVRRANVRSYWPEALAGLAFLLLVLALVADRFAHPWIVSIIIPVVASIVGPRLSRTRLARRKLEKYTENEHSRPAA